MERVSGLPPGLRLAEPADTEALAVILEERDRFYDVRDVAPIDERAIQIRATLFAPEPPASVLLMAGLQHIAATHGCGRIEWTTARHNTTARAFYERLGFEIEMSKLFYRVAM